MNQWNSKLKSHLKSSRSRAQTIPPPKPLSFTKLHFLAMAALKLNCEKDLIELTMNQPCHQIQPTGFHWWRRDPFWVEWHHPGTHRFEDILIFPPDYPHLHHYPAWLDVAADLMVGQEPLGSCGYSRGASISGCSIESIILRKDREGNTAS